MLQISKDEYKRKKGIAIATAQLLFHIDPDVNPDQSINEFLRILENKKDLITTTYGWTSGDEVARLILQEGLDTEEVKRRILHYKSRRNLTSRKKHNELKSTVADYLSNYCQKSKTYEGLFDQIQFLPETRINYFGSGIELGKDNIINIMKTLTEQEKSDVLRDVNARIDKRDADNKLGNELEKYLKDIGGKYGIDCYIDEFECVNKHYYLIKVYIGNRGILSDFNGTFLELRDALAKEIELEAEDKVTCPYCGRKIVRFVAMNVIKNCECGARIVVSNYSVTKGSVIYMKRRVSFRKPVKSD
ncbi:MAG: hypothetical protein M1317_04195 [Candidatus Thermoplasmatota archaeon]|nr:hypothetical protein [Candidatus Thermoplasmatota archaeon]